MSREALSVKLRKRFFDTSHGASLHEQLEAHPMWRQDILVRQHKPDIFKGYLLGLYFYHAALEQQLQAHRANPYIARLFDEAKIGELQSSALIGADLRAFNIVVEHQCLHAVHHLMSSHLNKVSAIPRLMAYAYLVTLADLSGGRIIANILRRKMPNSEMAYLSNISAIPAEDLEGRKQAVKGAIDHLPVEVHDEAVAELDVAVKLMQQWFDSLHQGRPFRLVQQQPELACKDMAICGLIAAIAVVAVVATMMNYIEPVEVCRIQP